MHHDVKKFVKLLSSGSNFVNYLKKIQVLSPTFTYVYNWIYNFSGRSGQHFLLELALKKKSNSYVSIVGYIFLGILWNIRIVQKAWIQYVENGRIISRDQMMIHSRKCILSAYSTTAVGNYKNVSSQDFTTIVLIHIFNQSQQHLSLGRIPITHRECAKPLQNSLQKQAVLRWPLTPPNPFICWLRQQFCFPHVCFHAIHKSLPLSWNLLQNQLWMEIHYVPIQCFLHSNNREDNKKQISQIKGLHQYLRYKCPPTPLVTMTLYGIHNCAKSWVSYLWLEWLKRHICLLLNGPNRNQFFALCRGLVGMFWMGLMLV